MSLSLKCLINKPTVNLLLTFFPLKSNSGIKSGHDCRLTAKMLDI